MSVYTPDLWVIVEVDSEHGKLRKVLGSWYGRDAAGDSEWIASWGSPLYPKEAGDLIFGRKE